ncbi:restriction endonuclease subunit S [uncultured Prevotella sp.]|uniref:restriction endonuclease subunit S n=1 Tax=uncultured Prevotella sp. TaxID=159272 RepID=UPI00258DE625|nr:restriction endonuclease subunit S [uncultured Prevotella sp.]
MITTINNKHNKLNVPNKREQNQTCLDSAEREGLRPKGNVPNLRFPEFQEEWEESTIGEEFDLYSGNTPSRLNKEHFNGAINWISSGELKGHYIADTKEKISDEAAKTLKMLPIGTFVIAIYGLEADGVRGTGSITKTEATISQACMAFISKGKVQNEFLYSWYKKHGNVIGIRYAQGTKQQNLSYDIIEKFKIAYPTFQEQEKLNKFIALLDERIATQNKIIEDLKKLKSAIIEKVFNGKHSEKLQLNDVGSYIRGLTYSSNDVVEHGGTLVMRSNNIVNGSMLDYNNNVVFVNKQMSAEQQLQNGDIVICMANGSSSLVGKSSFYDGNCHSPITVGAFCGIYRSKEPIVKWLFQTNKYRRYIWNSLQGGNGAIANLNGEDILNMSFSIPNATIKDTCVKMLTSMDYALENNMLFCTLYTLQKQYLLRQMFI